MIPALLALSLLALPDAGVPAVMQSTAVRGVRPDGGLDAGLPLAGAGGPDAGSPSPGVVDGGVDAGGAVPVDGGRVDAGGPSPGVADGGVDAGGVVPVDAGAVAIVPPPPPTPPLNLAAPTSMRVWAGLRSKLAIDTNFESRPGEPLAENVAELQSHARLGAEARFGGRARVYAEVRLWHRAVEERPPPGRRFWLFNGEKAKATAEVFPGEAYLDLYTPQVDFRLGNQVLVFGANAAGAPADVLDPLDLREGFLFVDPSDFKLPVLAARARGTTWGFSWTVAYVPFFEPDRYDLYGQDEALVQPGLDAALPRLNLLTRAQEDRAQQPLVETDRPKDLPQNGDVGLRVTRDVTEDLTVGADYVISREKVPEIDVDPELARFLSEGAQAPYTDPATSLSLSQRLAAGEVLFRGRFPRFAVGEVEASALTGPVEVDADLGYSAARLYLTKALQPTRLPTGTAVISVADAQGTDLMLDGTATVLWVQGVPKGQALAFLDPSGAQASAHDAWDAFVAAVAADRFLEGRFAAQARAVLDVHQRSYAFGAVGTWNATDRVHLSLGYEHFHGTAQSPLGYWRRNDNVWVQVRLEL